MTKAISTHSKQRKKGHRYPIMGALVLLMFGFAACNTKKSTEAPKKPEHLYISFVEGLMDLPTFEATTSISTSGDLGNNRFKCLLKGKQDSIVWGSIQKFGFEILRFQITPERIQMINRLERSYFDESAEEIQKFIGLSLQFHQIWNTLQGKPIFEPPLESPITEFDHFYQIYFLSPLAKNELRFDKVLPSIALYQLQQTLNPNVTAHVMLSFDNYKKNNEGKLFSYARDLEIVIPGIFNNNFTIQFDQIKQNANFQNIFTIPSHYTRMEI
jgi:hypothetical protein